MGIIPSKISKRKITISGDPYFLDFHNNTGYVVVYDILGDPLFKIKLSRADFKNEKLGRGQLIRIIIENRVIKGEKGLTIELYNTLGHYSLTKSNYYIFFGNNVPEYGAREATVDWPELIFFRAQKIIVNKL